MLDRTMNARKRRLDGRRITLCVTGSIAAYKAVLLLRLLLAEGARRRGRAERFRVGIRRSRDVRGAHRAARRCRGCSTRPEAARSTSISRSEPTSSWSLRRAPMPSRASRRDAPTISWQPSCSRQRVRCSPRRRCIRACGRTPRPSATSSSCDATRASASWDPSSARWRAAIPDSGAWPSPKRSSKRCSEKPCRSRFAAATSSSRRDRRRKTSIRCARSPIARRARWALRSQSALAGSARP